MIKVSTTGMAVSLKTDLRFPESGQHGHGSRIIQLNGLEMLSVYMGNDMEMYRDVLFYLGQILDGLLGMQIPLQSATWAYG